MQHGLERLHSRSRIAGDIDNQAGAQGSRNGAAQWSQRSISQSFAAHEFSETLHDAFADRARGLGRDIAGRNSSASGGDHKLRPRRLLAQDRHNLVHFIGNNQYSLDGETSASETRSNVGAGTVFSETRDTGVAHGDDNSIHIRNSTFG